MGQMHEKLMSICFFTIADCWLVHSRWLHDHRVNYVCLCIDNEISHWVCKNFCSYCTKNIYIAWHMYMLGSVISVGKFFFVTMMCPLVLIRYASHTKGVWRLARGLCSWCRDDKLWKGLGETRRMPDIWGYTGKSKDLLVDPVPVLA